MSASIGTDSNASEILSLVISRRMAVSLTASSFSCAAYIRSIVLRMSSNALTSLTLSSSCAASWRLLIIRRIMSLLTF